MPAERRDLIELLTCFFEKNHVKINFIIVVVHNIQKLSAWKLNYWHYGSKQYYKKIIINIVILQCMVQKFHLKMASLASQGLVLKEDWMQKIAN